MRSLSIQKLIFVFLVVLSIFVVSCAGGYGGSDSDADSDTTDGSGPIDLPVTHGPSSEDPDNLQCPSTEALPSGTRRNRKVDVVKLNDGLCYTADHFEQPSEQDECAEVHYHTDLWSLQGKKRSDSQPCGAAVESDIVKRGTIFLE